MATLVATQFSKRNPALWENSFKALRALREARSDESANLSFLIKTLPTARAAASDVGAMALCDALLDDPSLSAALFSATSSFGSNGGGGSTFVAAAVREFAALAEGWVGIASKLRAFASFQVCANLFLDSRRPAELRTAVGAFLRGVFVHHKRAVPSALLKLTDDFARRLEAAALLGAGANEQEFEFVLLAVGLCADSLVALAEAAAAESSEGGGGSFGTMAVASRLRDAAALWATTGGGDANKKSALLLAFSPALKLGFKDSLALWERAVAAFPPALREPPPPLSPPGSDLTDSAKDQAVGEIEMGWTRYASQFKMWALSDDASHPNVWPSQIVAIRATTSIISSLKDFNDVEVVAYALASLRRAVEFAAVTAAPLADDPTDDAAMRAAIARSVAVAVAARDTLPPYFLLRALQIGEVRRTLK
jgi:hypothetical protein